MPELKKNAMVSSTVRNLPAHRPEVRDACLRQGMFPLMMETLPAVDADAIRTSLEMVDAADLYVGVFAHRYGDIPAGHAESFPEMEYQHAVERGIPRLIFLMKDDHPVLPTDVETGPGAEKLEETWKIAYLSERQLGVFLSMWLLHTQQAPRYLEGPWVKFRNDVVHAGEPDRLARARAAVVGMRAGSQRLDTWPARPLAISAMAGERRGSGGASRGDEVKVGARPARDCHAVRRQTGSGRPASVPAAIPGDHVS